MLQVRHDIPGIHDFGLWEGFAYAFHNDDGCVKKACYTDTKLFTSNAMPASTSLKAAQVSSGYCGSAPHGIHGAQTIFELYGLRRILYFHLP